MSKIGAMGAVALLLLLVLPLSAGVTIFQGSDPGNTSDNNNGVPSARPQSDNAAIQFNNALSSGSRLITFENDPLGIGAAFNLGGGVSLQCINCDTAPNLGVLATGIRQSTSYGGSIAPNKIGYNVTSGGSQLFRFTPIQTSTLTNFIVRFDFANAIQAFGTYITGLQQDNGSLFLQFNDGTSQSFALTGNLQDLGGAQFIGFTTTASVVRVEFRLTAVTIPNRDIMGFDDIRIGALDIGGGGGGSTHAPEPSTYALIGGSLAALALWRKRRSA